MSERGAAVRAILTASAHQVQPPEALRILEALEELGWVRPEMARCLVAAAGGRVLITDAMMTNPPREMSVWQDPATGGMVVTAS